MGKFTHPPQPTYMPDAPQDRVNVDKGRWSRIPADERYCPCDNLSIQNELHVISNCRQSEHLRQKFRITHETPLEER